MLNKANSIRQKIIAEINEILKIEYGSPRLGNPHNPLEDLVFLILSPRTTGNQHLDSFLRVKERCSDFSNLLSIPENELQQCIIEAGLQKQKIHRLISALREIENKNGELTLDNLTGMEDSDAENFLRSLPGVGVKIARCVMIYTLNLQVFPVDVNIFRILERIGLISDLDFKRDKTHDLIQEMIPQEIRFDLHVNLVAHGRKICAARKPNCENCIINRSCSFYKDKKYIGNKAFD